MPNNTILLIGGPADGERVCVHSASTLHVKYVLSDRCLAYVGQSPAPPSVSESVSFDQHIYKKEVLSYGSDTRWEVFLHSSVSPELCIEFLIAGYRNAK